MITTTTTTLDRRHVSYLGDYCPRCNPIGDQADRCLRQHTLAEPDAVTWHGDKRVTCEYRCDGCGHRWSRTDLWDAETAGFVVTNRRAA